MRSGEPLTDFHTFQSLTAAKEPAPTRAHALARRADLGTSITRRDYRADGLWQAAYFATPQATISLAALRDAFLHPRFMLCLGRKSCPLAHPLAPLFVGADDPEVAFIEHARFVDRQNKETFLGGPGRLAVDDRVGWGANDRSCRLHRRNDDPRDRTRWHFSSRSERLYATRVAVQDEKAGP